MSKQKRVGLHSSVAESGRIGCNKDCLQMEISIPEQPKEIAKALLE